jgi:hypothetical protein
MQPWHGTPGGYSNHKCKCIPCKGAWNEYNMARRELRVKAFAEGRVVIKHGTYMGYKEYKCPCEACRYFGSMYNKLKRHSQTGVTSGTLEEMFESQGGACGCCGKLVETVAELQFDHDHETGSFRGLLCITCNTGIGKLGDTLDGVLKAVAYLKRSLPSELACVDPT